MTINNNYMSLVTPLHIPAMFTQTALPTPPDISINHNTKRSRLTYPLQLPIYFLNIPLFIDLKRCLPLKYPPQLCHLTYGSFEPPKEITCGQWKRAKNIMVSIASSKISKLLKEYHDYKKTLWAKTSHPSTPHHHIPWWTNPHLHRVSGCLISTKHPN